MCQSKICNVCKIEKPIEDFKKALENKDGRTRKCRECFKNKLYAEGTIKNNKEGFKTCSLCKEEKSTEDFYFRVKSKNTRQPCCKSCNYFKSKTDRETHKIKRSKRNVEYNKNRIATDPVFKFKDYIRKTIKRSSKKFIDGCNKSPKAEEILGCTLEYFINYIENLFQEGMNWSNHGHCKVGDCEVWNIDHKIPLASAKTKDESLILNHYSNLQPLWAEENLRKGSKILETYLNK